MMCGGGTVAQRNQDNPRSACVVHVHSHRIWRTLSDYDAGVRGLIRKPDAENGKPHRTERVGAKHK